MPSKPPVIIYRDFLLPPSETFVLGQAEALQRFTPYYVGSRLKKGLLTPQERTLVLNRGTLIGKAHEICLQACGICPYFFSARTEVKSCADSRPLRHRRHTSSAT